MSDREQSIEAAARELLAVAAAVGAGPSEFGRLRAALDMPVVPDLVHEAARGLLRLKDGPRDEDYQRRKPAAWEALRAALDEATR